MPDGSRADRVAVRLGRASDAEVLALLAERTFRETYAADIAAETVEAHVRSAFGVHQQAAELADPRATVLLAELSGAPVGYALLVDEPPPLPLQAASAAQLSRIYVLRSAQGRGVGAVLLARALRAAHHRDRDAVWLTVWERNPRAIAFYAAHGFVDVGAVPFQVAGERQTDRVLLRELRSSGPGRHRA